MKVPANITNIVLCRNAMFEVALPKILINYLRRFCWARFIYSAAERFCVEFGITPGVN